MTKTIDVNDLPYFGNTTNAPDVLATADRGALSCSRCGSSLFGRFEKVHTTAVRGTRKVYRCGCGSRKYLR